MNIDCAPRFVISKRLSLLLSLMMLFVLTFTGCKSEPEEPSAGVLGKPCLVPSEEVPRFCEEGLVCAYGYCVPMPEDWPGSDTVGGDIEQGDTVGSDYDGYDYDGYYPDSWPEDPDIWEDPDSWEDQDVFDPDVFDPDSEQHDTPWLDAGSELDVPSDLSLCEQYCEAVSAYCTGEHEITWEVDCATDCAQWPPGEEGDFGTGEDTVHCRLYAATNAEENPELGCGFAAPDSDYCDDDSDPSDPCAGVTCTTPPSATCAGNTAKSYAAVGTCVAGECSYEESSTNCGTHGECLSGVCQCEAGWSGPACSEQDEPMEVVVAACDYSEDSGYCVAYIGDFYTTAAWDFSSACPGETAKTSCPQDDIVIKCRELVGLEPDMEFLMYYYPKVYEVEGLGLSSQADLEANCEAKGGTVE